ncbi:MAG: phosphate acyltransferase PlsX [Planctomycetota bacterium]
MRIAVDAMGGDFAPGVVVEGALRAAAEFPDDDIVLVGNTEQVEQHLGRFPRDRDRVRVEHADAVVDMGELPVEALRRKGDTSIWRCAELAKAGAVDAILSAGNTGAAVAAASLAMGTLEGIRKPGIAAPFPTNEGGECIVIDLGANVKPKPEHLLDYGIMAAEYTKAMAGKPNPSIGLLNIGAEDAKGNELVKETHALFKASRLNFAGNIEGRDVFNGVVDAVVCDGFTGNVMLKVAEGVAEAIFGSFRAAVSRSLVARIGASLCRSALKKTRAECSSSAYGGAQLLGVNGTCIIAHGSSDAEAIFNAIRVGTDVSRKHVNRHIVEAVQASPNQPDVQTASA